MSLQTKTLLSFFDELDSNKQKEFISELVPYLPFEMLRESQSLLFEYESQYLSIYIVKLIKQLGFVAEIEPIKGHRLPVLFGSFMSGGNKIDYFSCKVEGGGLTGDFTLSKSRGRDSVSYQFMGSYTELDLFVYGNTKTIFENVMKLNIFK
jgi:hypothetical protein